jgi:TRAP transporter TAXI family solute receptor
MKKGWISLLIVMMLISTLTFTAYAKTPRKAAVGMFGSKLGTIAYVLPLALSEVVNRHSDWLRVNFTEGAGTLGNVQALAQDPKLRPRTIVISSDAAFFLATMGKPPFKQPYPDLRSMLHFFTAPYPIVTLDPNIKSIRDLEGKRFCIGNKGMTNVPFHEAMLDILGIRDKVKLSYMTWGEAKSAMLDGLIDAAVIGSVSPALFELMAARDVHFVDIPAELVAPVEEKIGLPWLYYTVSPKSISGTKPDREFHAFGSWIGLYCDASVDEDVVYECTKWAYEKGQETWKSNKLCKNFKPEDAGIFGRQPLDMVHPGALKYFKQHAIKVEGK